MGGDGALLLESTRLPGAPLRSRLEVEVDLRWWTRRGDGRGGRRQAQVAQDAASGRGVLDHRDDTARTAAAGAHQDLDAEGSAEQLAPRQGAALASTELAGSGAVTGLIVGGLGDGDDLGAPSGGGGPGEPNTACDGGGDTGGGDAPCCAGHAGVSCDDATCSAAVCAIDDYCCLNQWDDVCAELAADLCEVCGGGGGGPDPGAWPSAGAVRFTEVLPDPSAVADSAGEWFELGHFAGGAYDLEGCVIATSGAQHTIGAAVRSE